MLGFNYRIDGYCQGIRMDFDVVYGFPIGTAKFVTVNDLDITRVQTRTIFEVKRSRENTIFTNIRTHNDSRIYNGLSRSRRIKNYYK
jgi:hypothetical protein